MQYEQNHFSLSSSPPLLSLCCPISCITFTVKKTLWPTCAASSPSLSQMLSRKSTTALWKWWNSKQKGQQTCTPTHITPPSPHAHTHTHSKPCRLHTGRHSMPSSYVFNKPTLPFIKSSLGSACPRSICLFLWLLSKKGIKFEISSSALTLSSGSALQWMLFVLLVGCLTSQQHARVSQGRICSDNFTCCHTEIEVADPTFYLTQSQYTDTGPTSPSADPIMPGAWQGSHWSANF